jgi:hypothetical protein
MKKRKTINIFILIIALVAICASGYFYYRLHVVQDNLKPGPSDEVKSLVEKVSRLYLVPENEEPTIATVSDPAILKGQSFFNFAKEGDKVFIFTKISRAVLYRPSIDKIIEIAPIKNNPLDNTNSGIVDNKNVTSTQTQE